MQTPPDREKKKPRKKQHVAGPPQYAKNPMQDDYGNPTTKKSGDEGTAIMFPAGPGGRETYVDVQGAHQPNQYRGKTGAAARKARYKKRGY